MCDQNDLITEANHRISNSLNLLVNVVRSQAISVGKATNPVTNAQARFMLESMAARITMIAELHRLFAQAPRNTVVGLDAHLRGVCATLVSALSRDQNVRLEHSGGACLVPTAQVQPLTLILCEIFINAMKYAHPTGVPLLLSVGCRVAADRTLLLEVRDDGVGLPEDFDVQKDGGIGFRLIRSLVEEIGASLGIDSSPLGLAFHIAVPAAVMAEAKLA